MGESSINRYTKRLSNSGRRVPRRKLQRADAQNSEQDWSRYIAADESAVVEKVANPNAPENQPNRGLSLTAKAMARQKSRPKQKELEIATEKEADCF